MSWSHDDLVPETLGLCFEGKREERNSQLLGSKMSGLWGLVVGWGVECRTLMSLTVMFSPLIKTMILGTLEVPCLSPPKTGNEKGRDGGPKLVTTSWHNNFILIIFFVRGRSGTCTLQRRRLGRKGYTFIHDLQLDLFSKKSKKSRDS